MRGKQSVENDKLELVGITPAHAGKTNQFKVFAATYKDHPRACGENAGRPW